MRQNFDKAIERPLFSRFSTEINYCTCIAHWYTSLPTLEYPDCSSEAPPPGNSTLRKKRPISAVNLMTGGVVYV